MGILVWGVYIVYWGISNDGFDSREITEGLMV